LLLYTFLKPLDKEYYFNLYPCSIPPFTDPLNRTLPVELPFPVCNSDTLVYAIPENYSLKTTPQPVSISSRFGMYKLEFLADTHKLTVIRWFELYPGRYALNEYPDFYNFIVSVKNLDNLSLLLKPNN
jgi:hypothetical protein